MSSAPWGGHTESTTSLAAAKAATEPASSSSAVAARAQVSVLRPSEAQSTRQPQARAAAPTEAPISPGWSNPIVVMRLLLARDNSNPFTSRLPGCLPGEGTSVTRRQLLTRLEDAWKRLQASYAGLTPDELLEPGVTDAWSVRDILAHVTTWEEEALRYLPLIATGGTPPRYSTAYGGIDAFNARMTEAKRHLSLPAVLHQLEDTHRQLIALVQTAPDALITSETRFRHRLRLDTYSHYPLHAEAIRKWRVQRSAVVTRA